MVCVLLGRSTSKAVSDAISAVKATEADLGIYDAEGASLDSQRRARAATMIDLKDKGWGRKWQSFWNNWGPSGTSLLESSRRYHPMDEQKLVLDALQMGATPETMNSWLIKNVGGAPPTLASGMAGFSSFMNDITRGWKEGAIGPYSGARYNDLIELQRVARSAGWEYDPDAPVNNWRQRNIDDFVNYQKSYASWLY